jgi:hypothetical protein
MTGTRTAPPQVEAKEQFCALPVRAMGDRRLKAQHLHLLMAISWHDRLNRNGRGCYARVITLCKEAEIDPTNFSDLLRDLEQFGYARVDRTFGKRVRTIHLIYETKSTQLGAHTKSGTADVSGEGELGADTNLPASQLGTPEAPSVDIIERSDNNRCSETKIIDSVKQPKVHPSGLGGSDRDREAYTSSLQRVMPNQKQLQYGELTALVARLAGISEGQVRDQLAAPEVTNEGYMALAAPELTDERRLALYREIVETKA